MRQAMAADGPYQLIVVPLLTASPLKRFVDRVLVVDCDEETQLERLLERDGETEERARRILAAQASRQDRLDIADDVITNDGDIDSLEKRVDELHERYLGLARRHSRGF